MAGDTDVLLARRRGSALVLTFNRPGKLNAISSPMLRELDRRLGEAEADPEVRSLVLTGAGERAFVAGADIAEYAGADHEAFVRYQAESRRLFSWLDEFGKPVIGAVNGYALGGGFEIALCCDLLVASTTARFGLPEGLLGLSPGGGGTQRLTRAAGPFVAADVLMAGRRLTADPMEAAEVHNGCAKFDLTLSVVRQPEGLAAALEYRHDLFDGVTAEYQLREDCLDAARALAEVGTTAKISDNAGMPVVNM